MRFRFVKKIEGYDYYYGRKVKTGAVLDLEGTLAETAASDPDMELLDKPAPVKKAAPKKKAVKKAAPKKKVVKKARGK